MRSNFAATISRVSRGMIESEQHDEQLSAIKDLLGNWNSAYANDDATSIGEIIVDNMDSSDSGEILDYLLTGLDGETLHEHLTKNNGDELQDLIKLLLKDLSDDEQAVIFQEFGFYKIESE